LVVIPLGLVNAYPEGPPADSCGDMFPSGHGADAHTISAPFTLTASATNFTANAMITLWVNATGDATYPYYEGVFVQARKASSCNDSTPVGTFTIPANDNFLKVMSCSGGSNNAVAHKTATHETGRMFTWTAPATSSGHVFFRATVVKNEKNFWTNVFSGVIRDMAATTAVPSSVTCTVKMTGAASSIAAATSLVFAAFVMSYVL